MCNQILQGYRLVIPSQLLKLREVPVDGLIRVQALALQLHLKKGRREKLC